TAQRRVQHAIGFVAENRADVGGATRGRLAVAVGTGGNDWPAKSAANRGGGRVRGDAQRNPGMPAGNPIRDPRRAREDERMRPWPDRARPIHGSLGGIAAPAAYLLEIGGDQQ